MTVDFTPKEVEWISTILAKLDVKYDWKPEKKLKVVSSADT